MNIIEALKTGRNLRRPIPKHMGSGGTGYLGNEWVKSLLSGHQWSLNHDSMKDLVDLEDIMAEDWEVQPEPEKKVEVTKSQLEKIFKAKGTLLSTHIYMTIWKETIFDNSIRNVITFEEMCQELGLE